MNQGGVCLLKTARRTEPALHTVALWEWVSEDTPLSLSSLTSPQSLSLQHTEDCANWLLPFCVFLSLKGALFAGPYGLSSLTLCVATPSTALTKNTADSFFSLIFFIPPSSQKSYFGEDFGCRLAPSPCFYFENFSNVQNFQHSMVNAQCFILIHYLVVFCHICACINTHTHTHTIHP
jgi:hypothetical protein